MENPFKSLNKKRLLELSEEEKQKRPLITNTKKWSVDYIKIFNTSEDHDIANLEAETETPENFDGLPDAIEHVSTALCDYHGDSSPDAIKPAAILKRVGSFRVQLSNTRGNTLFRVRYSTPNGAYIAQAKIRRV